jgi:hypothetical protein
MEAIAESIIEQWKNENNNTECISLSSVKVKHCDHDAGIYTLYINLSSGIVRIKAIKESDTWKIIKLL